jgi:hypothetical protein
MAWLSARRGTARLRARVQRHHADLALAAVSMGPNNVVDSRLIGHHRQLGWKRRSFRAAATAASLSGAPDDVVHRFVARRGEPMGRRRAGRRHACVARADIRVQRDNAGMEGVVPRSVVNFLLDNVPETGAAVADRRAAVDWARGLPGRRRSPRAHATRTSRPLCPHATYTHACTGR